MYTNTYICIKIYTYIYVFIYMYTRIQDAPNL